MKNVLQLSLTKDDRYKYSNIYDAHVIDNRNIGITDIVDELIEEGMGIDKNTVLDIIARFNQKAANKVLSGNKVDTGLVSISPRIKGALNERHWNPKMNKLEIILESVSGLTDALSETTIEVIGENSELLSTYCLANQLAESKNDTDKIIDFRSTQFRPQDDPACGIAFRTWLCKA